MTAIPNDIMEVAVGVKTLLRFTPENEWGAIIGKALMEEREGCAKIASDFASDLRNPDKARFTSAHISTAIRSKGEPE